MTGDCRDDGHRKPNEISEDHSELQRSLAIGEEFSLAAMMRALDVELSAPSLP